MGTLGQIWQARKQILEGVYNTVVKDEFVETVAEFRMNICNSCEYKGDKCTVPGTGPCCGACGCSLKAKVRSLSSACGAIQNGEEPKWLPVLSQKQETELEAKELDELNKKSDDA